jgi:hypothetical protein
MANLLPCKGHGSGYCCLYKQRHVTPRGSTLPQTSDILHLHEYLGGGIFVLCKLPFYSKFLECTELVTGVLRNVLKAYYNMQVASNSLQTL